MAGGNRTAAAESNIVTDPEAAHIVPAPPDCHTQVAVDLDHARFWDLVLGALERIGEP